MVNLSSTNKLYNDIIHSYHMLIKNTILYVFDVDTIFIRMNNIPVY